MPSERRFASTPRPTRRGIAAYLLREEVHPDVHRTRHGLRSTQNPGPAPVRSARASPRGAPRVLEGCALRGRSRCLTFPLRVEFVCERRSSPRVLRYPASRRSHARRPAMTSRRREDGPPRSRRSCEVGPRRRPLLVLPRGPNSRFFVFHSDSPLEKSRFRLNAHTTPESHLLVANSKIELADEPLTNAPRARLVEGLGPAGAVRGSARAPDGTTDRAGDSARSPRRFGARGADQGKRDRHRSFGGPRPAASLGGRARGCRRLGRRPRGSGGFIVDTSRAFAGRASRSARARARVTSPRVDASPWRTILPC